MIHDEPHFQFLLALAAAGQLSDVELLELKEHTAGCPSCSQRMEGMESANLQLFLTLAGTSKKVATPKGMEERFLVRAANVGVPLPASSSSHSHYPSLHFAALVVAVSLILGMGWKQIAERHTQTNMASTESTEIAVPALPPASTAEGDRPPAKASTIARTRRRNRLTRDAAFRAQSSEEASLSARSPFRMNLLFGTGQRRVAGPGDEWSGLSSVGADHFKFPVNVYLTCYSAPRTCNQNAEDNPDQVVFHHDAALASVRFNGDQADFLLKARSLNLSFRDALDSVQAK